MRWKLELPGLADSQSGKSTPTERCKIKEVTIEPTYAYHDDYSRVSDSYGFKIKFSIDGQSSCFGYTGDTKWVGDDLYYEHCPARNGRKCGQNGDECPTWKSIAECLTWKSIADQYGDCDTLLIHLGSLIDHKNGKKFVDYRGVQECTALMREQSHPYLPGMLRFLKGFQEKRPADKETLILVGEFGEELRGGIRIDIVNRLRNIIPKKWQILPVDVGLDVILRGEKKEAYKFVCAICNKSRPLGKIRYERYGYDEAIFYVCQTCQKATPSDVSQDQLRKLYEVGRELRVLPNN